MTHTLLSTHVKSQTMASIEYIIPCLNFESHKMNMYVKISSFDENQKKYLNFKPRAWCHNHNIITRYQKRDQEEFCQCSNMFATYFYKNIDYAETSVRYSLKNVLLYYFTSYLTILKLSGKIRRLAQSKGSWNIVFTGQTCSVGKQGIFAKGPRR